MGSQVCKNLSAKSRPAPAIIWWLIHVPVSVSVVKVLINPDSMDVRVEPIITQGR